MKKTLNTGIKGFVLLLFFLSGLVNKSNATHIVGGELYYDCLGGTTYQLTLKLYRDCAPGSAMYDDPAYLSFWDGEFTPNFLDTAAVSFPGAIQLPFVSLDTCYLPSANLCIEEAIYITTVTLPASISGYIFAYQRCCRSNSLVNIVDPGNQGTTFFEAVPASALCNSSPRFNNFPAIAMCVNRPFEFDNSATDPDGDSLVYHLCSSLNGAEFGLAQPIITAAPPFYSIGYAAPFTSTDPINGVSPLSIDPITGYLTITPTQIGSFAIGICCDEYRSGVLIGSHFRDFQFNVVSCTLESDCANMGVINPTSINTIVYPNPTSDLIQIKTEQEVNVKVFDMLGKLVYHSTTSSQIHNISLSEWTTGVYTYRVYTGEGMYSGKFIKN